MFQIESLATRLLAKKRHVVSYIGMSNGVRDLWPLWKLAWPRFKVLKIASSRTEKHWHAHLRCLNGKSVHLNPTDMCHLATFNELFLQKDYDLELVSFIPDLILDLGAHIGLFSLLAASQWPNTPVLAFEPHPDNARWARLNLSGNDSHVTLMEAAVSTQAGWLTFDIAEGIGQLSEHGNTIVPCINFPLFLKAIPTKQTLLKMDIEGEELLLLPLLLPLLPKTCAVFVEIHGSKLDCENFLEQVKVLGFDYRYRNEKQSPDGSYLFIDLFLTRSTQTETEV